MKKVRSESRMDLFVLWLFGFDVLESLIKPKWRYMMDLTFDPRKTALYNHFLI
jgi:hypothetical protein